MENSCAVNFAYCQRRLHPGRTHRSGTGAAATGGVIGEGQAWPVPGIGLPRPIADPLDNAHCLRPGCGAPCPPHLACSAHFACTAHFPRPTHSTPSRLIAVVSPAQLPFYSSFLGEAGGGGAGCLLPGSNLEQLKESTRATHAKAAKKFSPHLFFLSLI